MTFEIAWTQAAVDDLRKLDNFIRIRTIKKINTIKDNPFRFVEHLEGYPLFKLRIGDYRAILDINQKENKIIVVLVGHRRNVYQQLNHRGKY